MNSSPSVNQKSARSKKSELYTENNQSFINLVHSTQQYWQRYGGLLVNNTSFDSSQFLTQKQSQNGSIAKKYVSSIIKKEEEDSLRSFGLHKKV